MPHQLRRHHLTARAFNKERQAYESSPFQHRSHRHRLSTPLHSRSGLDGARALRYRRVRFVSSSFPVAFSRADFSPPRGRVLFEGSLDYIADGGPARHACNGGSSGSSSSTKTRFDSPSVMDSPSSWTPCARPARRASRRRRRPRAARARARRVRGGPQAPSALCASAHLRQLHRASRVDQRRRSARLFSARRRAIANQYMGRLESGVNISGNVSGT